MSGSARPVVLLQPPASEANRAPCLDDRQYGLGILALAAWLEAHGVPVVARHLPLAMRQGRSLSELVAAVREQDPLIVAIGLNWVHFSRGALQVARRVRAAMPGVPIVIGGQHASLFCEEIIEGHGDVVDAVIVGEAERPLLAICDSVRSTGRIQDGLPGVRTPGGETTAPDVVADIDSLPLYSYRSMSPAPLDVRSGAVTTTRGACPYRCAYCVEPVLGRVQGRPRLTFHSAERIAEQMAALAAQGVNRFTIQDGFFVGGDALAVRLAAAMRARGVRPAHLNVFAHPESFGPDGFSALASAAELASVDLGVETGAPEVAAAADRPGDCGRAVEAVREAVKSGVVAHTWWLVGLPGDGAAARQETRALLLETMRAGGIPRWVSTLVLLPRTPMHVRSDEYGVYPRLRTFEDYARFSDTSLAEALHFPDVITHTTDEASADDILEESKGLRRFILDHFSELERFHAGNAGRADDLAKARQSIATSFF